MNLEFTTIFNAVMGSHDAIEEVLKFYDAYINKLLRLCFDDAKDASFWQNLMTNEQADAICAFVLRYCREIDQLIIHCTQGVSRSPAVAAGIFGGLRQDESLIWDDPAYRPNSLVYRLVREAFARGVHWKKSVGEK